MSDYIIKKNNPTNPLSPLTSTIVFLDAGPEKTHIEFLGCSYISDNKNKPYKFIKYSDFIADLVDVAASGLKNFAKDYGKEYEHSITNCTEKELRDIFNFYAGGKPPIVINERDLLTAKSGFYEIIR